MRHPNQRPATCRNKRHARFTTLGVSVTPHTNPCWPLWAPIIQVVHFSWHLSVICQSSTKHTIPFVACPLSSLRPQTVRLLHSNRLLALARTKSIFTHFLLAHLLLVQFLFKAHHSRFMFALFFPFCPQKHTFSFGVDKKSSPSLPLRDKLFATGYLSFFSFWFGVPSHASHRV